ncbi:MAG TPA: TIM barrel protein [Ramlibacter sp.]|jgi:sugar phosphate isomerase/epimerase|uniref:sugar phosphate isomerase/epimerase family protein n=1 Tax=Ramlibacter sp. TaxID=1917967 RepID=UPI002D54C0D2|nr:TIM barrel protein [Ramlibacter sp.]HZY16955.1 TIM barrel protein [Ramlibacter sp.]
MQQVLISLGAFGAAEVRRHGQLWFTRLAQDAGADGVEVRGELLADPATELPALAAAVRERGSAVVYSSPEGLWAADGSLDAGALERALAAATAVGAPRLKMSIGGFGRGSAGSFAPLAQALRAHGLELLIENDQTVAAGTLVPLQAFFARAQAAGLPLGMTFDMGNWHWTGECPLDAARLLGGRVAYVHTKGVQRQPQRWVAVPLADSAAPWRSVLRQLPRGLPWAIEYPLQGDDLAAVTRAQVQLLREVSAALGTGA